MATENEVAAKLSNVAGVSDLQHVATAGQKYVYRAIFNTRTVAIKAALIALNADPSTASEADLERRDELESNAARFRREIEILGRCNSESIVALAEPAFFELPLEIELYGVYAEEWINGENLRALFRQRALSRAEAIELGLSLCNAVSELDKHGYVHRDIKPQNVMRRDDGRFVLVDPGMALDRTGLSLTSSGNVPGTAPYVSPEQWDPRRKRDLDARSDMFAIGIVLFEGLTRMHPFAKAGMSTLDIMTAARSSNRAKLENEELRPEDPLRGVVERLLSENPHGRYRDTNVLREALEAAR